MQRICHERTSVHAPDQTSQPRARRCCCRGGTCDVYAGSSHDVPHLFARVFWHYTVVQKVAQDAGRYLSTVSMAEMRSPLLAQEAAKVASRIAKEELAALQPGKPIQNSVVQCNLLPCGSQAGITPGTIRIMIAFSVFDTFSGVVDTGRFRLTLTEDVTYSYVGT